MLPQDMYENCTKSLKDYADKFGFSRVVVGVSGGIDSALVLCMCVDAFGADKVQGVLLPGPFSTDHSVSDAEELCSNLDVEFKVISITEAVDAFDHVLTEAGFGTLQGLALENTQARCRMICLMALSNQNGWMVVNTGNKSEAMMGYSTLYGDMVGAFAPLGGIYKTDVYALVRWRNEQDNRFGRKPAIPENTIVKPPSAELSPGQKDEESLGMPYEVLDKILIALVEQGKTSQEVVEAGFPQSAVDHIAKTMKKYRYKQALEPPYPSAQFYS